MVNGTPGEQLAVAIGRIEAKLESLHQGQDHFRTDLRELRDDVKRIEARINSKDDNKTGGAPSTTGVFRAIASSNSAYAPFVSLALAVMRNPAVQTVLMLIGAVTVLQLFGVDILSRVNFPTLGPPTPAGP